MIIKFINNSNDNHEYALIPFNKINMLHILLII